MITLHPKQTGAVTLLITFVLFIAAVLIIIFAANYSMLQQKTSANQYDNNQAFEAAEAGLEYAVAYLQTNSSTVLANPTNGYINYSISSTSLANNASYSVTYTNPTQNNFNILTITSTGTSADSSSTHVISQLVNLAPPSLYTVTTQGSISVNGHGGTVTGSYAITAGGSVDPSAASSGQVIQNNSAVANESGSSFFSSIFSITEAQMQSQSTIFNDPNSVPWSSLANDNWINGDVSISTITAGSAANPITLIINGNFSATGNTTIYGIVYVTGTVSFAGNALVNGALVSQGNITLSGNGGVNYNSTIINQLLNNSTTSANYAKVPGSWKDF